LNADPKHCGTPKWKAALPFGEKVTSMSGIANLKQYTDEVISVNTRAEFCQVMLTLIEQGFVPKGWSKGPKGFWQLAFKMSRSAHL